METYCAKCGVRLIRDFAGWTHVASLDVNTRHKPRPTTADAMRERNAQYVASIDDEPDYSAFRD